MRKAVLVLVISIVFTWGNWLFGQSLELDKLRFNPGESINVSFQAPANLPENAWVGIIPSNIPHGSEAENDKHDLTYQYLKFRTSGTLVFTAPSEQGEYDFRMHDTDSNGKEIASISFSVGIWGGGTLTLDRSTFSPGERIAVQFTASADFPENAWVGIIPAHIPHGSETENDKYDLTYQYLKKNISGTLIFNAPGQPGAYDFRMFDTDSGGKEVTSVTFNVN